MSATITSPGPVRKELPGRITTTGWVLLLLGIVMAAAGYFSDPKQAAFDNVIGFLFLTSIAVGSVFLLALEYITGAAWSVPMRRIHEFLAGLTPLAPLVAIPALFHAHDIFHWTHTEAVAGDPILSSKQPYLNMNFFLIRFAIVSVLWILFYRLFTGNSLRQDTTGDPKRTTINIRLAAVFIPIFAITLTVTAVDWAMSLEPHWFSTIFGVYYFSGTILAAVSAATFVIILLHERGDLPGLRRDHFYSLGALLFAFINFWAYIAFSQFLLIWYANLPEETVWFMARWKNGWEYVSIFLIIVHFAVPYFGLLSQDAKMDLKRLKFMALWILAAHLIDLFWLVMPTHNPSFSLSWVDAGFPILIVGMAILILSMKMKNHNLVPIGDPKLQRGLDFRL